MHDAQQHTAKLQAQRTALQNELSATQAALETLQDEKQRELRQYQQLNERLLEQLNETGTQLDAQAQVSEALVTKLKQAEAEVAQWKRREAQAQEQLLRVPASRSRSSSLTEKPEMAALKKSISVLQQVRLLVVVVFVTRWPRWGSCMHSMDGFVCSIVMVSRRRRRCGQSCIWR